jgi:hypothetical protein
MAWLRTIVLLAFLSGLAVALWPASAVDSQALSGTVEIRYDCDEGVPWPCTGGALTNRWQLYHVRCDAGGCQWQWVKRIEPNTIQEVFGFEQYRMYIGPEGNNPEIYDCHTFLRSDAERAIWEWFHRCDRRRDVCRGEKHWQVYRCYEKDGECPWEWATEITDDCTYAPFKLEPGKKFLIHWGLPRELEEVGPTNTPTGTPAPTSTASPTNTPDLTGTPTSTPEATATSTDEGWTLFFPAAKG